MAMGMLPRNFFISAVKNDGTSVCVNPSTFKVGPERFPPEKILKIRYSESNSGAFSSQIKIFFKKSEGALFNIFSISDQNLAKK